MNEQAKRYFADGTETGTAFWVVDATTKKSVGLLERTNREGINLVIDALNRQATFDQAREALKDACLTYAVHGEQPPQNWLDALAAME